MTLDKHLIDGVGAFEYKTLSVIAFEQRLKSAGYTIAGTYPAKLNRIEVYWIHPTYRRVKAIYSPDKQVVITAYHPND